MKPLRPLGLFVGALLCVGCVHEPESVQKHKPRVKVSVLSKQAVPRELESFGSITFLRKSDLSNLVEGTVDELSVQEGSPVRSGQILVRLKNPQLEMRKIQAEAALGTARSMAAVAQTQLWDGRLQVQARLLELDKIRIELDQKQLEREEAERNYRNKQQLFDVGGTTQESLNGSRLGLAGLESAYRSLKKDEETKRIGLRDEDLVSYGMTVPDEPSEKLNALVRLNTLTLLADVDSAKAKLAAAQTEVQSAEALVGELTVRAPFDGILGAKYVETGEHVQPGTKLVTLMDTSAVFAVFPVQEDEAVGLREGLSVEVTLDAFPGQVLHGRVELVSPLIDAQSGAVSVKARLSNSAFLMKPGMFARVRVKLGEPLSALVMPESAVSQKTGSKARVYAVVNGRVLGKEVELGRNQNGRYVVLSGAQEKDLIIESPSALLQEGEEVDAR